MSRSYSGKTVFTLDLSPGQSEGFMKKKFFVSTELDHKNIENLNLVKKFFCGRFEVRALYIKLLFIKNNFFMTKLYLRKKASFYLLIIWINSNIIAL